MPDFRVADTAPEHPKLRAAGLAAAGLWSMAGAYCMRELTDGWVPDYWVLTWSGGRKAAATLVAVGLWSKEVRQGMPGYRYHDWFDIQRSAESIEAERAEGRARARRSRENRKASAEASANVHRTFGERSGEASGERSPEPPRAPAAGAAHGRGHAPPAKRAPDAPLRARDAAATHLPAETSNGSEIVQANVRPESHDSRALTRALSPGSSVGRGTSGSEREGTRNGPRPRCLRHAQLPHDAPVPPCGACMRLRVDAERQAADRDQAEAEQRALRRELIDACPDCDPSGMREFGELGVGRCTHPALEAATGTVQAIPAPDAEGKPA